MCIHQTIALALVIGGCLSAGTPPQPGQPPATKVNEPAPLRTTRQHWDLFLSETFSPLSLGGVIFNSVFSQVTKSDPQYGTDAVAFGQRVGASAADIAAQNFFGDFVVASVFHEDPRYIPLGHGHSTWDRFVYAVSRAFVIRKSSGGNGFDWDNFLGSAMSAGFSNLYYPPASRTSEAYLIHFATNIADNGFVNLAPEFWPDFKRKVFGHHRGR